MKRCGLFLASVLCLSGCVAIDPRVGKEPLQRVVQIEAFSGTYRNSPIYRSETAGFVGPSDFADALGFPYAKADVFRITADKAKGLSVELLQSGTLVAEERYTFDQGLTFTKDGVLQLPSKTAFGDSDSPTIGVARQQISLSLNRDGHLVVVQTGGGAGFVTVLPMGVYGKLMAIFPRMDPQSKEIQ